MLPRSSTARTAKVFEPIASETLLNWNAPAALAIVLARRPQLWLLDEPHAGLDVDGRELLDDVLRRAAAAGATVLFASHELDRAVPLATRVLQIQAGRVAELAC